jgi:hypothetical protein
MGFLLNGVIVANTGQQTNRGISVRPIIAYIDTDNTLTFYVPQAYRYSPCFVKVDFLKGATSYSTAVAFNQRAVVNRTTNIAAVTAIPLDTLSGYYRTPTARVFEGLSQTATLSLFVNFADGNDNDLGTTRATALKTVTEALSRAAFRNNLTLTVNATKTVVAAYAAATVYAVGDLCTSGAYV